MSIVNSEKDIKKYVLALYEKLMGVVEKVGNSRVCRNNKVWVEVSNQEDLMRIIEMKSIMNG